MIHYNLKYQVQKNLGDLKKCKKKYDKCFVLSSLLYVLSLNSYIESWRKFNPILHGWALYSVRPPFCCGLCPLFKNLKATITEKIYFFCGCPYEKNESTNQDLPPLRWLLFLVGNHPRRRGLKSVFWIRIQSLKHLW